MRFYAGVTGKQFATTLCTKRRPGIFTVRQKSTSGAKAKDLAADRTRR
jgi:hypothetical protein